MKLKIDKIFKKDVDTKYGRKVSYSILSDGTWFNAWENKTTAEWYEGQVLDLPESYISESNEYKGKKTYKITFPKPTFNNQNSYQSSPVTPPMEKENVNELKEMVRILNHKIDKLVNEIDLISKHLNGFNSIAATTKHEIKPEPDKNELDAIFDEDIPF